MNRLEVILKRRILAAVSLIMTVQGITLFSAPQRAMAAVSDSLTLTFQLADQFPPKPVNDLAAGSSAEGQASLAWTAPSEDSFAAPSATPVTAYVLRAATFSVTTAGSTTTWWNTASDVSGEPAPALPGNPQFMNLLLEPGATYWFALKSQDEVPNTSPIDDNALAVQATAVIDDDAPPAPALNATPGSGQITLTWNAVGALDLDFYRVTIDSTTPLDFGDAFQVTVDSASTSYPHTGLTNGATYSYYVTSVDKGAPSFTGVALESVASNIVTATPSSSFPNSPTLAVDLANTTTTQIRWLVTDNANNENGMTVFAAPMTDVSPNLAPGGLPGTGTVVSFDEGGFTPNVPVTRYGRAYNVAGSSFSASLTAFTKANPPMGTTIVGVTSNTVTLSWNANGNSGITSYDVQYANNASFSGAQLAGTTTSTSFTRSDLAPNTHYWFRVLARNGDGVSTAYDVDVSTKTNKSADKVKPRSPTGIWAEWMGTGRLKLHWRAVTESEDGTSFDDPAPERYRVYRCKEFMFGAESYPESWTTDSLEVEDTMGTTDTYYYKFKALDANGNESDDSMVLEARGDGSRLNLVATGDDGRSRLNVPVHIAKALMFKETNNKGDDIIIRASEMSGDEKGRVIKSVKFEAFRSSTGEVVKDFVITPAEGVLMVGYEVSNGQVLQGAPGAKGAGAPVFDASKASEQLSMFWHNGNEWVKVGGTVDTESQTVQLRTSRLGRYQVRQAIRVGQALLTRVYPQIFTPNDDGWNDKVIFEFDNPALLPLKGEIFDASGAKVADMTVGPNPDISLMWDGKRGGQPVPGGVYIYQVEVGGESVSGTVVVAQ